MHAIKSNGIMTWLSQHRREFLAFLALVLALALAACDYRVDTSTSVNENLSGTRVISASFEFPASHDKEEPATGKKKATVENINAALRAKLPAGVEMKDFTTSGAGSDRKLVGSFTVKFSSAADFTKKMQDLRLAGLKDDEAEYLREEILQESATIQKADSPLVNGVTIDEPYPQSDLIKWGFRAMEQADIDFPSYSNLANSSSVNVVTYGKAEAKQTGDKSFRLFAGTDDGAPIFNMTLNLTNPKEYTALIELGVPKGGDGAKVAKYKSYLESVKPSNGTITSTPSEEATRLGAEKSVGLQFTAKNFGQLNTELKKILGGEQNFVSLKAGVGAEGHGTIPGYVTGYFGCANVCSEKTTATRMTLQLPQAVIANISGGTKFSRSEANDAIVLTELGNYNVDFGLPLEIRAVTGKIVFDGPEKARAEADVDVKKQALEEIGLNPTALFSAPGTKAKVTLAKAPSAELARVRVVYPTMTVAKLNETLARNSGLASSGPLGSLISFNIAPNGDGLLKEKRDLNVNLSISALVPQLAGAAPVSKLIVEAPSGYSFKHDERAGAVEIDGNVVTAKSNGDSFQISLSASAMTITAWVLLGIFLGIIVIGVILLIVFRKRIAAWNKQRNERNAAKAAAAGVAVGQGAASAADEFDAGSLLGDDGGAAPAVAIDPAAAQTLPTQPLPTQTLPTQTPNSVPPTPPVAPAAQVPPAPSAAPAAQVPPAPSAPHANPAGTASAQPDHDDDWDEGNLL